MIKKWKEFKESISGTLDWEFREPNYGSTNIPNTLMNQNLEIITSDISGISYTLDDFNELPGLFYVSLKIREKNQLNQGIILSKIHLSEYYNEVKDTFQSKKFAYEALKLASSFSMP